VRVRQLKERQIEPRIEQHLQREGDYRTTLADTIMAVWTNALEIQTNYFLNHWLPNLRGVSMNKEVERIAQRPPITRRAWT
jgi:hypothetical protein